MDEKRTSMTINVPRMRACTLVYVYSHRGYVRGLSPCKEVTYKQDYRAHQGFSAMTVVLHEMD